MNGVSLVGPLQVVMTATPNHRSPLPRKVNEGSARALSPSGFEGGWQVVQATEFVRLLRAQLREMTSRLAWLERQDLAGRNDRERELRLEAVALRRDIEEAEILIDRLRRLYLSADTKSQRTG